MLKGDCIMGIPEFATVAGIVVICYLIGMGVKASPLDDKYIPLIVGCLGGCLGVVGMLTMPEFPADNYIDAVAVGIASGLAATGVHQIGKQLSE
jgi:hypothetical protein